MTSDVAAFPVIFKTPSVDDRAGDEHDREALVSALMRERRSAATYWTLAEAVDGLVLEAKARGRLLRFPTLLNRSISDPFRGVRR